MIPFVRIAMTLAVRAMTRPCLRPRRAKRNRVKVPGLVTLLIGLLHLLLALLLAGVFGWGVYGLAAAGALSLSVRHLLFTPLYGAKILNRPLETRQAANHF